MAVVWVDIWDSQNGSKAKSIINWWFNVGHYIGAVHSMNMNPGIPQCKNYWKWCHSTLRCRLHRSRCIKCNSSHNTEHHREMAWCYKENLKRNPPRLETKKGEPCSCSFKCINCKGHHQADSNDCPFWKNCFNKEWHSKKQQELHKSRATLTHLVM